MGQKCARVLQEGFLANNPITLTFSFAAENLFLFFSLVFLFSILIIFTYSSIFFSFNQKLILDSSRYTDYNAHIAIFTRFDFVLQVLRAKPWFWRWFSSKLEKESFTAENSFAVENLFAAENPYTSDFWILV